MYLYVFWLQLQASVGLFRRLLIWCAAMHACMHTCAHTLRETGPNEEPQGKRCEHDAALPYPINTIQPPRNILLATHRPRGDNANVNAYPGESTLINCFGINRRGVAEQTPRRAKAGQHTVRVWRIHVRATRTPLFQSGCIVPGRAPTPLFGGCSSWRPVLILSAAEHIDAE